MNKAKILNGRPSISLNQVRREKFSKQKHRKCVKRSESVTNISLANKKFKYLLLPSSGENCDNYLLS